MSYAKFGAVCLSLIGTMLLLPKMADAGEVTLVSRNDEASISGDLIEIKDDCYVINTELGILKFATKGVYCKGADCPKTEALKSKIDFIGSNILGLGLMPLLLEGYARHLGAELIITDTPHPDEFQAELISDNGSGDEIGPYRVSSQSTESGFAEFITRKNAINMASRKISPDEARALRLAGKGNMISPDQEHVIAMDSLVVIVNPQNPVSALSIADLKAIYSGSLTNWSQLGGDDRPIKVITHQKGSEALTLFNTKFFGDDVPPKPVNAMVGPDSSAIAAMVNINPAAIGFVSHAFQRGAKPLNLISECGITYSPDPFSVKTEEYMLERRLYLYTDHSANREIRDFIKFATSEDANALIAKSGFIDFGIVARPQTLDDPRVRALQNATNDAFEAAVADEMLKEMENTSRLSATFHFRDGSSRYLDEMSMQTLKRLTGYLQDLPAGTKVTLAGFTDDVGKFKDNQRLSDRRARKVAELLRKVARKEVAHIDIATAGYGELVPSACNNTESGRRINRRVEVWVSR